MLAFVIDQFALIFVRRASSSGKAICFFWPSLKVLKGVKRANAKGAKIVLNIYGDETSELRHHLVELGEPSFVVLHGRKNHQRSLCAVAGNDALLACLECRDYTDKVVPMKLYEYLMIPRPILAILPLDGYAAEVLRIAGRDGWIFSPQDDLGEVFLRFYREWREGFVYAKNSGNRDFFCWEKLICQWEEVINSVHSPLA